MQANYSHSDVIYLAKVRIFQQITTGNSNADYTQKMSFTLQRYDFFRKSQLEYERRMHTERPSNLAEGYVKMVTNNYIRFMKNKKIPRPRGQIRPV